MVRGFQDGLVASNVCHGTQSIKDLGSRNTGNHVHGECSGFSRGETFNSRLVLHGVEHGDDGGPLSDSINLAVATLDAERPNLEEDIALREDASAVHSVGPSQLVSLI